MALFGGALGEAEREGVEAHLDGCADCRALVGAYAAARDWTETEAEKIGPYALVEVIGEGGMGVVWRATRTTAPTGDVALKILKVPSEELSRRALREAHVAAVIDHPSIVEVREVLIREDGAPVLVMELLEGESLDRHLCRRGRLPAAEALAILAPLAEALLVAHEKGVIHRDLKPSNVFLQARGAVKLLDFGLAKLTGFDVEALTKTGAILGTPHYMAPEQLYGETNIDARADVWAVGAIAYEMLTGKRPLAGASYAQIVRAASRQTIAPVRSLVPDVHAAVAALVEGMLQHDREARGSLVEVLRVREELG